MKVLTVGIDKAENGKNLEQGICPNCGSSGLNYDSAEFSDNAIYYPYECGNCGINGQEWYHLEFTGHNIK